MTEPAAPPAAPQGDAAPAGTVPKKGLLGHPVLLVAGASVLVLAIVLGVLVWLHERTIESTDDAFIDTRITLLAPQVAGRITQVLVNDNSQVSAGQVLALIDPMQSRTRVAQALADTAQARAAVATARDQIGVAEDDRQQALADVANAVAQADLAARDLARYRALQRIDPRAVAQQQIDQALAKAQEAAAMRRSAQAVADARTRQIAVNRSEVNAARAKVQSAQAQLGNARLDNGYTRLIAPLAGHIAQETMAVGDYVQAGTQVLAIVPLDLWITANFKETQLALMRPGQHVAVKIDSCPGVSFAAHVDSIQRGAGQAFAILPPQNATGNYVKVVQRVPVKIVFDRRPQNCLIGPGMSVEPTVTVR